MKLFGRHSDNPPTVSLTDLDKRIAALEAAIDRIEGLADKLDDMRKTVKRVERQVYRHRDSESDDSEPTADDFGWMKRLHG